jgi:hypothetical protein
LEEDTGEYDVLCEEAPDVLVRMGPESLPILQTQLIKGELPDWGDLTVIDAMKRLGVKFPETQAGSVEILRQRLEAYEDNDEAVNGWLVHALVTFQAVDAAPLIEAVYADGNVEDMFAGPWPKVQVDLELKQESDFEPDELLPEVARRLQEEMGDMLPFFSSVEPSPTQPAVTPNATPKQGNPNPPPKFGDGFLSAPKSAKPKGKGGFGQGGSAGKKKKKK